MAMTANNQYLILGAATGYNLAAMLPFVVSLKKTGYRGRLCLFVWDLDKQTIDGDLRCFKADTGERLWSTLEVMGGKKANSGTFFMVRTPQQWVLFNDSGELILADISPAGYKEKSRARIVEPLTPSMGGRNVVWSHPGFANRCVFARNDKELICVSLAAE